MNISYRILAVLTALSLYFNLLLHIRFVLNFVCTLYRSAYCLFFDNDDEKLMKQFLF